MARKAVRVTATTPAPKTLSAPVAPQVQEFIKQVEGCSNFISYSKNRIENAFRILAQDIPVKQEAIQQTSFLTLVRELKYAVESVQQLTRLANAELNAASA